MIREKDRRCSPAVFFVGYGMLRELRLQNLEPLDLDKLRRQAEIMGIIYTPLGRRN